MALEATHMRFALALKEHLNVSIRVVSERFDMEDAVSIIRDYPVGAITVFSTNRKKTEAKQEEYFKQ